MLRVLLLAAAAAVAVAGPAAAGDGGGGIQAERGTADRPTFDIVHAKVEMKGRVATFRMVVAGEAGKASPEPAGRLGGAPVFSYVWPTSIDPAEVGFEAGAGMLALAVTIHPDFDDTPLFDENRSGDAGDDGGLWHSHWVVLTPDETCGPGALKVADIPEGAEPRLPPTWPGLPILIDSPGWSPIFSGEAVEVRVPFADAAAVVPAKYDGVTAGLRVNESVHAPLLCVTDVFDVASGDLSLPGRVAR